MPEKEPLYVICGPTATGKTNLGIKLAQNLNGELISADSRQVYTGMDIGTGKDLSTNAQFSMLNFQSISNSQKIGYYTINGIQLWLYDVINPDQRLSAFEWAELAKIVIADMRSRRKIPIVVGGSGLYIKALTEGFDTKGAEPDWNLRNSLNTLNIQTLQQILQKENPTRLATMNNSDYNNPRRLIRAIEITHTANKKQVLLGRDTQSCSPTSSIGLTANRKTLNKHIDKRVDKRVQQGIISEIRSLLKQGYSWDNPGFNTMGYKEWQPYFENTSSKQACIAQWKHNEHAYAKRQITWFQKQPNTKWFSIDNHTPQRIVNTILHSL